MTKYDPPLDELRSYSPKLSEPPDLDEFWETTIADARSYELDVRLTPVNTGLVAVRTWSLTYAGFGGQPVSAWLHLPATAPEQMSAIIQYPGYGGSRGLPHESILWAAAGYAHLVMDTRRPSRSWSTGDTPDALGSGSPQGGYMTKGINSPHDYFYRRLFVDAVRAVDAICQHPRVDPGRIAVAGRKPRRWARDCGSKPRAPSCSGAT